jgi:hypothetical protein
MLKVLREKMLNHNLEKGVDQNFPCTKYHTYGHILSISESGCPANNGRGEYRSE